MKKKTIVLTGANSGIGFAAAKAFANDGHRVIMVCRNQQKAESAMAEILDQSPEAKLDLVLADLSLMKDVRKAAESIALLAPRIDVLINNAGIYLKDRMVTDEGIETVWAVNHLAPLLLTTLLRPQLKAAENARVITLSSWGHWFGSLHFDNLQGERRWQPMDAYGRAKLANIMTGIELGKRMEDDGISVYTVHPGAIASNFAGENGGVMRLGMKLIWPFLGSSESGADTVVWLATVEKLEIPTGSYVVKRKKSRPRPLATNKQASDTLWKTSCATLGIDN